MKVVEYFEIQTNNFQRRLFAVLTFLSVFAFMICLNQNNSNKWIALCVLCLFAGGWVMAFSHKIIVQQSGFEIRNFGRTKFIKWANVSELNFDMSYTIHSAHSELKIFALSSKMIVLHVEQYQSKSMQRFFEILNEQCIAAYKNEHFLNQALGKMNWRNKLKMF